jgi:N-acetylmuramoyl-L-alanine amidase
MLKRLSQPFLILFILISTLIFYSFTVNTYKIKTVVIDAGHGGHDTGCLGSFSREKDVTLAVALKLGAEIQAKNPDIKVIYTRSTDEFIELAERANIANKAKADVFISIHCNANPNKSAYGTETYAMGLSKSEANLNVAKRENSVILLEENYETTYDGFDPQSTEAYIIFSLYQNENLDKSVSLAAKIQNQFSKTDLRFNRGVKQESFLVLWRTNMPAILIETGFLTNKEEEQYLTSENGQNAIASSILRAFNEFKAELEKEN